MTDSRGYSRRRVLAGAATLGAGIGSSVVSFDAASALFTDSAQFVGNVFTAGEVDLRIAYDVSYTSGTEDTTHSAKGTVNGAPDPGFDIDAIRPGDEGSVRFCPVVVDNPSYLWLCGGITKSADGGGATSGDGSVALGNSGPPDGPNGELGRAVTATLSYCFPSGQRSTIVDGSLAAVLSRLEVGLPLEADPTADGRTCFAAGQNAANPCLCLEWQVPDTVGNVIQGDEFEFDLVFHARQCRHNDGTRNPCVDGKAISFVSFCAESGVTKDDVTIERVRYDTEGEPIAVTWNSTAPVDTVVLKYATVFENFYVDGATSGTVSVGAGDEWVSQFGQDEQTPSDPCPDGQSGVKYEYEEGAGFYVDE